MVARLKYLELLGLNNLFFTLETTWHVYMYEGMHGHLFTKGCLFSEGHLLVKRNIEKT